MDTIIKYVLSDQIYLVKSQDYVFYPDGFSDDKQLLRGHYL